jgi:hypothetical protein
MHHKPVVMGELILLLGEVQISARPSTRYSAQYQEAYSINDHSNGWAYSIIMRNNLYVLLINLCSWAETIHIIANMNLHVSFTSHKKI